MASEKYNLVAQTPNGSTRLVPPADLFAGWRDLRAPLIGGRHAGTSDPTLTTFGPTGNVMQFVFVVGNEVMLAFHIDHDIRPGSTCYPHVHWSTDGTETATVKWELNYTLAPRNDVSPIAFGAEGQIYLEAAAPGTAWAHIVTEDTTGFVIPNVDSLLLVHLKRVTNGGTNNTDDVFGLFLDIHYECQQYATPSRAPDFFTI